MGRLAHRGWHMSTNVIHDYHSTALLYIGGYVYHEINKGQPCRIAGVVAEIRMAVAEIRMAVGQIRMAMVEIRMAMAILQTQPFLLSISFWV